MTEQNNYTQPTKAVENNIELHDIFSIIWRGKWIVILTTFLFASISVFYSLRLPDIYRSEVLLSTVSDQFNGKLSGQLGGLATLAGISSLGSKDDKSALAIQVLKSRDFLSQLLDRYDFKPEIMAVKNWDKHTRKLTFDSTVYNEENKEWKRQVLPPFESEPSLQETHREFLKALVISKDNQDGFFKIAIEHQSPYFAKYLVELLVKEINKEIKNRDLLEAEKSISFLQEQIQKTNVHELKASLYGMVQDQMQKLMLAKSRDEYVFIVIDSALVPENKSRPRRALIVIFVTMLGGFAALCFLLLFGLKPKLNQ